jgi:hypothetical protein
VLVWPEAFNTLVSSWQGGKIQEEKDESDKTEEDFSEAMLHFLALSAKNVTCNFAAFGKKCRVLTKAGFPELRAL